MADPLTLALLAVIAALLRGDRAQAEQIMGRLEADGTLTPLLEVGAVVNTPQLAWEPRLVAVTPTKLFDADPSQRRRVVIWNTSAVQIRVAESQNKLAPGGVGGLLDPGAVLIDEPPNPHGGEWWAVAAAAAQIDVAQQL